MTSSTPPDMLGLAMEFGMEIVTDTVTDSVTETVMGTVTETVTETVSEPVQLSRQEADLVTFAVHCVDAEEWLQITLDKPMEGEQCPLSMEPIEECGLVSVEEKFPFKDFPDLTVAVLPCGHRFNCLSIMYSFMYNGMKCPVCRSGSDAIMDFKSVNCRWAERFNAEIAAKKRANMMEALEENERVAEQLFRSENGLHPFTTTLFISRHTDSPTIPYMNFDDDDAIPVPFLAIVGRGHNQSTLGFSSMDESDLAMPIDTDDNPGLDADREAANTLTEMRTQASMALNTMWNMSRPVRPTPQRRSSQNSEQSIPGRGSERGSERGSTSRRAFSSNSATSSMRNIIQIAPGSDGAFTLHMPSPIVTVEMVCNVYLYSSIALMPVTGIEFNMKRVDYRGDNGTIEFGLQMQDVRLLSTLIQSIGPQALRACVSYITLFGGLERVGVSPRVRLEGQSGQVSVNPEHGNGTFSFEFHEQLGVRNVSDSVSGISSLKYISPVTVH
jgi:hypothetical protein